MTWVEVASDAIKIGLGALIGGIIAYLGDVRKDRQVQSNKSADYTRNLLKESSSDFGKYYQRLNVLCFNIVLYFERENGTQNDGWDETRLREEIDFIRSNIGIYTDISFDLQLIGELESVKSLDALIHQQYQMIPHNIDPLDDSKSSKEKQADYDLLGARKKDFMNALRDAFEAV